ncbi:outer membrane beta-barrel family protein [Chitinophaga arvensicola]|uniref:Outer membrane receptor proteins, mostly Fe transport n=1 Tax=Chitinophaga arvensicola TaxID=29529 RepID=A0A1I0RDY1_9BACT|nr:outer membrane beta-barrel family protein [Chitinophaga arvensicola]SEW39092.1 Outer membrane receptor proteins, mostly Fe transport [Chitinophaga arvensicola]
MRLLLVPVLLCISTTIFAQDSTMSVRELKSINVTSKKKTIEFKGDKIIYNVSTSVNAMGSNALELLKQSPGVMVGPSNSISLNGKGGVTVYIDGKPSYMQGDALAALLKSLQSANIQSIELMPNPSGKYDAAGSGGIINIRLKKLTASGYNGDISAGIHFGETPKTEAALNMNYRTGKFNLYGNYNHYFGHRNMRYGFDRVQAGQLIDNRTADTDMRNPVNFKAGVDYNINSRHTLGVMMNANLYFGPGLTHTLTDLSDSATGQLQSVLKAKNDYYSQKQNWKNYNFNYQYKDTAGRTFTADLDYGAYRARIKNILYNAFLKPDGITETDRYSLRTLNSSDINIYGIKADYEQPISHGKLYTGVKWSTVESGNRVRLYDVKTSSEDLNIMRSNDFRYDEKIYAAYLMADQQWGQWKLQAALRAEQTDAGGALNAKSKFTQQDTVQQVNNRYLGWFPSFNLTWKQNDISSFSLLYNRKIDRPTYADLNPFEYQMDELSFWKGNSFLRPQYANSVTVGYNASGILAATVTYTHIRDMFVSITDSIDGNKMIIMPENVGSQNLLSLNVSSAFTPLPWWNVTANANFFHKQNRIDFDAARAVTLSINTVMLNLQQVFDLDAKTQVEVSGYYQSPDLGGGYQRTLYVWQVNVGVQRKVWKEKGTVRIGISDLFQTSRWASLRDFDGLYYRTYGSEDSRQLKLGFSYRFGNIRMAKERDRSSGLENESRRVK